MTAFHFIWSALSAPYLHALKKKTPNPEYCHRKEVRSSEKEIHAISSLVVAPQTAWAPRWLLSLPAVIKRPELQITASEKCRGKHPPCTGGKSSQWFCTKNNPCLPLPDSRQAFDQLFSSIFQCLRFSEKRAWFRGMGCDSRGERSCKTMLCFVTSRNNLKLLQFTSCFSCWWETFVVKMVLQGPYVIFSGSDLNTTVWILPNMIWTAQAASHQQNGLR